MTTASRCPRCGAWWESLADQPGQDFLCFSCLRQAPSPAPAAAKEGGNPVWWLPTSESEAPVELESADPGKGGSWVESEAPRLGGSLALPAAAPPETATAPLAKRGEPVGVPAREEAEERPARFPWLDPLGVVALLLGGSALLCAALTALGGWVVPLALVGLLTGGAAVVRARASDRARLLFTAAGAATGGAVLGAALLCPGLLGPSYRAFREQTTDDPAAIHVVPLPGSPASVAAESPDWVDASRAALRQNGLSLQVVDAWVGPRTPAAGAPNTAPREECLFISLRVQQVRDPTAGGPPGSPPPPRDTAHAPTLTDDTGQAYQPRKGPERDQGFTARGMPVTVRDEVLAFEPPPAGREYLRLEVPAAGWGRPGAFRFTIPGTMIRRPAPGPGRRPGR
jgi:hypothetical protein